MNLIRPPVSPQASRTAPRLHERDTDQGGTYVATLDSGDNRQGRRFHSGTSSFAETFPLTPLSLSATMDASRDTGNRNSRRKSVDADLNLVPYIDLLTCMVAFLLITAVWTQLARLEVQQKGQGSIDSDAVTPQTKIAIIVTEEGFALVVNDDQKPLGRKAGEFDYDRLATELKDLKTKYPDKGDVQVLSEDQIKFDSLVKTMDTAMAAGFPNISLLDSGSSTP